MLANVFLKGRANRLRFYAAFLIPPRRSGPASKAFGEAITEALADSSMATVNLGWRTSPDNGPAIGAASRLTADCCHPERSARQPAAKQGCRIQRLPYRLRLPVLLPSLPCLAVKNSLVLVPQVLGVTTIVFILIRLLPGDPAYLIAGSLATKDVIRHRWSTFADPAALEERTARHSPSERQATIRQPPSDVAVLCSVAPTRPAMAPSRSEISYR
jgi:hypothetical protein